MSRSAPDWFRRIRFTRPPYKGSLATSASFHGVAPGTPTMNEIVNRNSVLSLPRASQKLSGIVLAAFAYAVHWDLGLILGIPFNSGSGSSKSTIAPPLPDITLKVPWCLTAGGNEWTWICKTLPGVRICAVVHRLVH
ncbi:hypothetical protein DFH06DRAFT_1153981 [Mycena polygramma]|nr:hypothetical protein DFH06DRAFT_1153981 [Mycena polygramma]